MTASYFVVPGRGGGPRRTFTFEPRRTGGFVFRLTRPIGLVDSEMTARKTDSFVAGAPFGPVLVPRGGAAVRLAPRPTDPVGVYTVLVIDPRAGSRARAVLVLES